MTKEHDKNNCEECQQMMNEYEHMTNLQDFLEEERKEFEKKVTTYQSNTSVKKENLLDFFFTHDQRFLAFLKERVEEILPKNGQNVIIKTNKNITSETPEKTLIAIGYSQALSDIITLLTR